MSAFANVLQQLKEKDQEFVTLMGGREIPVKIRTIQEDWVVLIDTSKNQRYDMHATSVVIVSAVQ
jgi:hypothetical protein